MQAVSQYTAAGHTVRARGADGEFITYKPWAPYWYSGSDSRTAPLSAMATSSKPQTLFGLGKAEYQSLAV